MPSQVHLLMSGPQHAGGGGCYVIFQLTSVWTRTSEASPWASISLNNSAEQTLKTVAHRAISMFSPGQRAVKSFVGNKPSWSWSGVTPGELQRSIAQAGESIDRMTISHVLYIGSVCSLSAHRAKRCKVPCMLEN
ncbi:hypothetical protein ILYODFUR_026004 [Ilyodon furcidens]|uniref:Uncharacterized protein n=1 Tax=Ilyodon furcidens TaxID=33524 RepID=A0ABV0VH77_9TELE